MHLLIAALVMSFSSPNSSSDPGPLVRTLWLLQRYGTSEATAPKSDQHVKGVLSKALGKDGMITLSELGGLMEPKTFEKLAGDDAKLDAKEVDAALEAIITESRKQLLPKTREHADFLTTTFDLIDEPHREAGAKLADWIARTYRPHEPLNVIIVCTGNSRRSILGATMGNIAAAYYGMPEIRFYSGGTAPTAFNSRTMATLKAIGVDIEPTGTEAKRGEPETANLIYRVRWGDSHTNFEAVEFSKHYGDSMNPQEGFAALMVCGDADAACPIVKGAAL